MSSKLLARDRGSGSLSVSRLRAAGALRGAIAPGVCPISRYGDGRERAFAGLVRSRFLKVPRTTSAGKPDANFLLEIKHGLNDAQQKFHAEWRGQSTIRPPINGKGRARTPGLL